MAEPLDWTTIDTSMTSAVDYVARALNEIRVAEGDSSHVAYPGDEFVVHGPTAKRLAAAKRVELVRRYRMGERLTRRRSAATSGVS